MSFQALANHLLDLGKRNRLLNYKEAGYKGISVLTKDTNSLYRGIIDSREYKIPLLAPILERQRKLTLDEDSDIIEYSKAKVFDIISPIIKKNELILWKPGYSQERILRGLAKEYKFSISEKGINTLYLAFGFIEYKEGKEAYRAPLLLIPLLYQRQEAFYKIKEREDEIILNPTLAYYFKEELGLTLPNILSEDEELDSYLARLNSYLKGKYPIYNEVALGIFSFNKMTMYDDLANNQATATSNKCIRALIYKEPLPYIDNKEVRLYPVKDYDSSQLEAIRLAALGNSFTLEGPPGSGKSQTITNIIATLLGNGKKILFVSEKLAALEVVYNNLKRVGLSDFAIELHSNKANKKDFIEELYKTATLPQYSVSKRSDDYLEERKAYKSYLDSYINELYKKNKDNTSIYDDILEYLALPEIDFSYDTRELNSLASNQVNEIARALGDYSSAIAPLGYSYKDLCFHILISLSQEYVLYEINADLEASLRYLYKLKELKSNLNKYIKIKDKEIVSINELYSSMELVSRLNSLSYKSLAYFDEEKRAKLIKALAEYKENKRALKKIDNYDLEILELDLNKLYRYMKGSNSLFSRLFDSTYRSYRKTILGYRVGKVGYNELIIELKALVAQKKLIGLMDNALATIREIIPGADIAKLSCDLELTEGYIGYQISFEEESVLTDALIAYRSYYAESLGLIRLAKNINPEELDIFNVAIELALARLRELYLKRELIKEYYHVDEALERIKALNALGFLDSYLAKGLPLKDLATAFKREQLRNKIIASLMESPALGGFNSTQFDQRIKDFADLDSRALAINRDIIIAANSEARPDDMIMGSAFSLLARENSKLKRKMPIRMLMDSIMEFILAIKPVFLMSPLSVATYLNSRADMFDCVIFDEASQIFAWDALGSIYRAKQCIIIGDSKQMPPSAFFSASADIAEDDYDAIDMESILDMATGSLMNTSLRWHYRSRSEELIEFSNRSFYDHRLITIPEASLNKEGLGIDLVYLENGVYNSKTRTNELEAEKICDLVLEHLSTSDKSLGVVAFSQVQADLIEDMLLDRISRNPSLQSLFKEDIAEPFFVKNLETVQGDERDRIIFSICYGYNENHKFYQRFGPLNNLGGERRLNVAITRAKYNITVVTSIKYTDIRPSEALGCILLHDYLKFCTEAKLNRLNNNEANSLISSIAGFIKGSGYEAFTNYGSSEFKISIAVKNKGANSLDTAIMVDNEYDRKNNTTDRCRLLQMLLERQGFRYYRIYAPAWFNNKEAEEARLLKFLEEVEPIRKATTAVNESYLRVDSSIEGLEGRFRDYRKAPAKELLAIMRDDGVDVMLKRLIEEEAPITRAYLYKRVAEVLEKKSVTKLIRGLVDSNIPSTAYISNDTIWTTKPAITGLRINADRGIDEIPIEELMDGIIGVVEEAIIIDKRDCYKAISRLLGFKRLTENAIRALDNALVFLELEGKIVVANDKLSI